MGALNIHNLSLQNIDLSFDKKNYVFKDLCFELPMNEIVLITGKRGAGKSAFLKILAGTLLVENGSYIINEDDVCQMSFNEFAKYRKQIGYSFDFGGLLSNMTLYQNLILPLRYHNYLSEEKAHQRVMACLETFGLVDSMKKRPSDISGGMRKEACVARSFVMRPEMLLLDDPTTGMSATNREHLLEIILEQRESGQLKHIFISTEDPYIIEGLVTKMIKVENKKLERLI